jgi:hypothetical protein
MMDSGSSAPLQGCLYCHAEGSTSLTEKKKFFGLGSDFPVLKCSQCGATALFDANGGGENWRICYRRVSRAPRFYFVAIHLGKAGWLSASNALAISTAGYVQRTRVQQARMGHFDWLYPTTLNPPPPLMSVDELIFLMLKGVTYQQAPPSGFLVRADQGMVLDSGKFYVTDQKLHLLGQRRDWSHRLSDIHNVKYDNESWTVYLNVSGQLHQYRGLNAPDQYDAQVIAVTIETLWRQKQMDVIAV